MDENAVRSLLDRAAEAEGPPTSVNIDVARRTGRRTLRLRRIGIPAAALCAVAVIVGLVASGMVSWGHGNRRQLPAERVRHAPKTFNPLAPYAAFGWLPRGYAVTEASLGGYAVLGRTAEALGATDRAGNRIDIAVFPLSQCHVTGPPSGQHRRQLTCNPSGNPFGLGPVTVRGPAPGVLGGHAYWWADTGARAPGLVYRSARAWVNIEPALLTPSAEIRIAAHVRFGSGRSLVFPFQLAGLPSRQRAVDSSTPWMLGRRMVGSFLVLGPENGLLTIGLDLASRPASCGRDTGWQHVTVDGRRGILRTIYGADHFQTLCFANIDGFALLNITVSRPFSGPPVTAAKRPGGVIDIYLHHLRLLGPDQAKWTTHPVAG